MAKLLRLALAVLTLMLMPSGSALASLIVLDFENRVVLPPSPYENPQLVRRGQIVRDPLGMNGAVCLCRELSVGLISPAGRQPDGRPFIYSFDVMFATGGADYVYNGEADGVFHVTERDVWVTVDSRDWVGGNYVYGGDDGRTNFISILPEGGNYLVYIDNVRFQFLAIPEPATWALMIAGFGLVGSMMRNRRVAAYG